MGEVDTSTEAVAATCQELTWVGDQGEHAPPVQFKAAALLQALAAERNEARALLAKAIDARKDTFDAGVGAVRAVRAKVLDEAADRCGKWAREAEGNSAEQWAFEQAMEVFAREAHEARQRPEDDK